MGIAFCVGSETMPVTSSLPTKLTTTFCSAPEQVGLALGVPLARWERREQPKALVDVLPAGFPIVRLDRVPGAAGVSRSSYPCLRDYTSPLVQSRWNAHKGIAVPREKQSPLREELRHQPEPSTYHAPGSLVDTSPREALLNDLESLPCGLAPFQHSFSGACDPPLRPCRRWEKESGGVQAPPTGFKLVRRVDGWG